MENQTVYNTQFYYPTTIDFINEPFVNDFYIYQQDMIPFMFDNTLFPNIQEQPGSPESMSSSSNCNNTNTKSYTCEYCDRSFARKYDKSRHQRIHTGLKPYVCPCCNKGFTRSDARIRHFRNEFTCKDGPIILKQLKKVKKAL